MNKENVRITYDPNKRLRTLAERRLDFEDSIEIFMGDTYDTLDERYDYGETRMITIGYLRERMMVVIWTARGDARHVISMRKANDREQARFGQRLSRN